MAGTVQVVAKPSSTGALVSSVHATLATTNEFPNGASLVLIVTATGAVALTLKNQTSADGNAGADKVISFTTGQTKVIGPFPHGVYNLANGNMQINIDTPANISACYALQVGHALV